jgi:hypothetical protein
MIFIISTGCLRLALIFIYDGQDQVASGEGSSWRGGGSSAAMGGTPECRPSSRGNSYKYLLIILGGTRRKLSMVFIPTTTTR